MGVAGASLASRLKFPRNPHCPRGQGFPGSGGIEASESFDRDGRAQWVQATYITDDTEDLAARANQRLIGGHGRFCEAIPAFEGLSLPPVLARKMGLLKLSLTMATPSDPKESQELTRIAAAMEGAYGKGKYCPAGAQGKCLDWKESPVSWPTAGTRPSCWMSGAAGGTISPPIRKIMCASSSSRTKGARELGFADTRRPVALENTTCFRTISPRSATGCGCRCAALRACTLRAQTACVRSTALRWSRPRAHSGAPAWKRLGPSPGKHLSAGGAAQRRSGLSTSRRS